MTVDLGCSAHRRPQQLHASTLRTGCDSHGSTDRRPLAPRANGQDINDAGQIAGNVEKAGAAYSWRAYVWDPIDGYTRLTVEGYESAFVSSLNESGLAVGFVDNDAVAPRMAAWDLTNGEATVFPPPPGVVFPVPDQRRDGGLRNALTAVNNHSLAVGPDQRSRPRPDQTPHVALSDHPYPAPAHTPGRRSSPRRANVHRLTQPRSPKPPTSETSWA